jgi:hypothetical protein
LGSHKSIAFKDTVSLQNLEGCNLHYSHLLQSNEDIEEIIKIWQSFSGYYLIKSFPFYPFIKDLSLPILNNSCFSHNIHVFINKYLRASIGELNFSIDIPYNRQAFQFLQDLMNAIRRKGRKERDERISDFANAFYRFSYTEEHRGQDFEESDVEGGGLGIIHTLVDLGEE